MSEPAKPGILDRLRARYGWFDHLMRANERFEERKGNYFAAGLTYYTLFALFPLLMVGFSVVGFMLSRRRDVLTGIDNKVISAVPGALGQQVVDLMNSAIDSRASVGVIGLAAAAWVGLNWMANLRVALSEMWGQGGGFARIHPDQVLRLGGDRVVVRGDPRHPGAERTRRCDADRQDTGVAGYSQCACAERDPSRCVDTGVSAVVVVGIQLDDRPTAQGASRLRHFHSSRMARGDRF